MHSSTHALQYHHTRAHARMHAQLYARHAGKLLAGINSRITLYRFSEAENDGQNELTQALTSTHMRMHLRAHTAHHVRTHEHARACMRACVHSQEISYHGHILALYVQSRGDFIVVGDLMKSVSLLVYAHTHSRTHTRTHTRTHPHTHARGHGRTWSWVPGRSRCLRLWHILT